jgi:hypothetical protein
MENGLSGSMGVPPVFRVRELKFRRDPVDDYRGFIDEFRSLSSDAVLFLASPSFGVEPGGGVDERILIPADLVSSWYRPIPPSQPFFTDLCSSFLQVLSFRRRRKAKYAAG